MNGYAGTIVRVDLTTGRVSKEPTPEQLKMDFIGGRGFGAYYLFSEVPAKTEPLSAANKVIISTGPLSGLMIPGAGKMD